MKTRVTRWGYGGAGAAGLAGWRSDLERVHVEPRASQTERWDMERPELACTAQFRWVVGVWVDGCTSVSTATACARVIPSKGPFDEGE